MPRYAFGRWLAFNLASLTFGAVRRSARLECSR
jgi:hypothetical protein